jgi:ATP-dependent DNA helicase RecG
MTDSELEALLLDLESDRTERKASIADKSRIRQAICAFANDMPDHQEPGVLYIGANDDGSCAGLEINDQLLQTLADMRSDGNILPIPTMIVQKRHLCGCELAVVIVQPSDFPPVRYQGRVWIRVGPRRAIASAEEERRLNERRRARDLPFDLRAMTAATIDDLNLELFQRSYLRGAVAQEILEQNDRPLQQQLASLRFVAVDEPSVPTIVGLIAVGKSPADFIPGAFAQFLRIDGTVLSDPIADQQECHGPLPDLIRELDQILRANIHIATDIVSKPIEQRMPDYPLGALQQYVRNAVMHRDYETSNAPVRITWFLDRVEIQNPGGPYGQVTCQNFGDPGVTDYRNPSIAEAMKAFGFVQRFGVGLQLAEKELANNGNPQPGYQVEENYVLISVYGRGKK